VGRGSLAQIAVTNAVTFQSAQLDDGEGLVLNKFENPTLLGYSGQGMVNRFQPATSFCDFGAEGES
jgi:hypothetical protein